MEPIVAKSGNDIPKNGALIRSATATCDGFYGFGRACHYQSAPRIGAPFSQQTITRALV
jgi:hypothetical protein